MSRNHCNWMLLLVVFSLSSIGNCSEKIEKIADISEKDPKDDGLSKSYHGPQMSRAAEEQVIDTTNMNQYNQRHNSVGKVIPLKNAVDMNPVNKGVNDKKKEVKIGNKLGVVQPKKEEVQKEADKKTNDSNVDKECFLKCCCESKLSQTKIPKSPHLRAKRMDQPIPPCKECGAYPVNGKCREGCRLSGTHTEGNTYYYDMRTNRERMPPPPPRLPAAQPTAALDRSNYTGGHHQSDAGASSSSSRDRSNCDCTIFNAFSPGYICPVCNHYYDSDHFDTEGYYHPPSSSSTNINFGQVDLPLGGHGTGGYYNNPSSSTNTNFGQVDLPLGGHGTGGYYNSPSSSDTNTNFGHVDLPLGGHGTGGYYNNPSSSSTNTNFGQIDLPLGGSDRMCHCENTISYGYYCPECYFHSIIFAANNLPKHSQTLDMVPSVSRHSLS